MGFLTSFCKSPVGEITGSQNNEWTKDFYVFWNFDNNNRHFDPLFC